jgi:hypothetical protein
MEGKCLHLFGLSKNEQAMLRDEQSKECQDLPAEHTWHERLLLTEEKRWKQFMNDRGLDLKTFKEILWRQAPEDLLDPFEIRTPAAGKGEEESMKHIRK